MFRGTTLRTTKILYGLKVTLSAIPFRGRQVVWKFSTKRTQSRKFGVLEALRGVQTLE